MGVVNDVFGPISSQYCLYFYILSVIGLVFFAMVFIGIVFTGISKKLGFEFYAISILYSFNFLFMYLQNRLLYNMCGNSI
jgi:hypothetical protein